MAKVLLANKLASREVLQEILKDATPETNIGEILVESDILSAPMYNKVRDYVLNFQRQQERKAAEAAPVQMPEDGLGVPLASMLQETALVEGRENSASIDLDGSLDPTAFQIDLDPSEARPAEGLSSNALEAVGLEQFRSRVMENELLELTPRMAQVDDLLFEMAERGELSWEQATRRSFDRTKFPSVDG